MLIDARIIYHLKMTGPGAESAYDKFGNAYARSGIGKRSLYAVHLSVHLAIYPTLARESKAEIINKEVEWRGFCNKE